MNPVQWFEIATSDIIRAQKFYSEVFQFELIPLEVAGSTILMFPGGPKMEGATGALIHDKDYQPSKDGSIIYFGSEDISLETSRVEAAGGKLLFDKMPIGEFGFIAQFIDTEGNKIGLHSNK